MAVPEEDEDVPFEDQDEEEEKKEEQILTYFAARNTTVAKTVVESLEKVIASPVSL